MLHQTIQWPTNQKAIEWKILGYFVREFEKNGAKILDVKDGGTEELDFLLTLPGGKAYLELMEAVLPATGIPFGSGHGHHEPIPYADKIFEGVRKKIAKYGMKHEVPIDLLIYITHEQYNPNDAALWVLRRYFAENQHPFQYVFFLVPIDEVSSQLNVLYTKDHRFELPPLEDLAERSWINLVGAEAKLIKGQ